MPRPKSRPFGVTVIALLLLVNGLFALAQEAPPGRLYQERAGLTGPDVLEDLPTPPRTGPRATG